MVYNVVGIVSAVILLVSIVLIIVFSNAYFVIGIILGTIGAVYCLMTLLIMGRIGGMYKFIFCPCRYSDEDVQREFKQKIKETENNNVQIVRIQRGEASSSADLLVNEKVK